MAGDRISDRRKKLKVKKSGKKCDIFYWEKAHFYRGLTLLFQNGGKEELEIEEKVNFHSNGMMMDCSRNGVPTVDTIKQYVVWMASLGMNRLYLYMEDTLEIQGYPFWGYLRGRYGREEMQECDGFAALFGITLVPCIQTLAHLRTALHLPAFADYKDIDDILLLEEEKTKDLLSGLLTTVAECFSGGIVHLGMDEAAHLGRGKYMDLHEAGKGGKADETAFGMAYGRMPEKRAEGDDLVGYVFAAEFRHGKLLWDWQGCVAGRGGKPFQRGRALLLGLLQ